jgi:hypothetical protein
MIGCTLARVAGVIMNPVRQRDQLRVVRHGTHAMPTAGQGPLDESANNHNPRAASSSAAIVSVTECVTGTRQLIESARGPSPV